MEHHFVFALAVALAIIVQPINCQSTATCTGAMISNFGPCINFITSGSNTSSPSRGCCDSLKSLMSNGQDCLCLIITGGSSLQIPINRTLAMSLPRACRTSGVPIECKAVAPAPGNNDQGGSNTSPGSYSPPSIIPQSPSPPTGGFMSPPSGGFMTPPTGQGGVVQTLTPPGMRPTLTPSAAHHVWPSFLATVFGALLFCCY